jgi:hypothetical protein
VLAVVVTGSSVWEEIAMEDKTVDRGQGSGRKIDRTRTDADLADEHGSNSVKEEQEYNPRISV